MMTYLYRARDFLRLFVELAFFFVLAVLLLHLVLGDAGGPFVSAVADNVIKFANAVPSSSLLGMAIIIGLVYLIMQRTSESRGVR